MIVEFINIFNENFRLVQRDGDKSRIFKIKIENRFKVRFISGKDIEVLQLRLGFQVLCFIIIRNNL